MGTVLKIPQDPRATLSISDLAERTGLTAATLRTWESRHGFPEPVRLPGRHRRYTEEHVNQVLEVLRRRTDGLTLEAAIAEATDTTREEDRSIFAGLRRRHPQLVPRTLRKSTLLALTHAMEDECCARAKTPILIASFQHERFFAHAEPRWSELARTARTAVVFADFASRTWEHRTRPLTVHVPESAPMRREWTLVCDAPDYPVCLTAWEIPGQHGVRDADRRFESVWSLDPVVVRDASRIGLELARTFAPDQAAALPQPSATAPREASADLREATSLFTRLLTYLDRVR